MNLERAHPRRTWSVLVTVALVGTVVYFVVRSEGNVVPALDLHDSGIWVSSEGSGRVGRTNTEIKVVDTTLYAQSSPFELFQDGPVVVLRQYSPSRLSGVDPATAVLIPGPQIPDAAVVGLAGGTSAVFDPGSGQLFAADAPNSSAALAVDPAVEGSAIAVIDGPGRLAVGTDGLVHLLAVDTGEITTYTGTGDLVATRVVARDLVEPTLTTVGPVPVVVAESSLYLADRDAVDLSSLGEGLVVQESGPAADHVVVAADGGFARVPLDGGAVTEIDAGDGRPARPVIVAGCAYGAWNGAASYVQFCDGGAPRVGEVPQLAGEDLRFRANRGQVTLNSLETGAQLLFTDEDPVYIDDAWEEALSDEIDDVAEDDEEIDTHDEPVCGEENHDPTAEPDEGIFGTRPGIPVVVYPMLNDGDPDCDVLLIDSVDVADPESGTAGIVESGRAVQVEPAPGADAVRFDYTISDGRGGTASSTTLVRLVADGQNAAPVLEPEETTVVTGGSVNHNVLSTAYDPDGDVLRLRSATIEDAATGTVRFTDKGDITFTATDTEGITEIAYVVSDGEADATGVLAVTVVNRDTNQPPDARKDSATTFVGREVTVDVLDNDTDADGDALSIVRATADGDASVHWDPTSPEIRVTAERAGTINVTYQVSDGQDNDEAVFRVDVRGEVGNLPPVAVRDDVLLAPGIAAYLPVVANDVDPDGSVLVVLGVDDLPDPSPIAVTVLQRSVLKITTDAPLTEPVRFSYRISDGADEAVGRVLVEPAEPNVRNRAPIAVPDEYTVRAGGVATLPVLANDSDPDADPLTVDPPPDDQPTAGTDGRLFLSPDGQLRFEAPRTPVSTVRHIYSAADSAANVSSAEVVVHVLAVDDATNTAPVAPTLTGRTVAGQPVTVPVPVTAMDPDGDAVTFLGLDSAPTLGTVTDVGHDEFVYVADESAAGTDEFTYRVVDSFGQASTGTVLVGVAGRSPVNNRPVTVDDLVAAPPGGVVRIRPLANDSDPDGDVLTVSTADEDTPTVREGTLTVDGRDIVYTAPDEPTAEELSFRYVADDGRGLTRGATVTVVFRTEDNNRPPVAADDTTTPQSPGSTLVLDLLDNDEDPDDDELAIVAVSGPEVTIVRGGRAAEVTMGAAPVQFTYLVSDGEFTARAAVFVPLIDPEADQPPIAALDVVEVDQGDSIRIPILDNDSDPEGARLHLLGFLEPVRHGSVRLDGDAVTFTASEENYAGDAGFYYRVGDTADPATANTAVGAVQVRIRGEVNTRPSLVQLEMEVPAGTERRVDLTSAVVDPDTDDSHTFDGLSLDGRGLDADLDDDGILVVAAASDATPGSVARATFTVSDGVEEVTGSVRITVMGSDAPLPVLGADVAETVQSVPVTVDVLANDTNPFPETPLRITSVGSPGAGSASVSGSDSITFDPGEWFGTATIPYTVADGTGDPTRQVEGTLTVEVIGFPDAPAAPSCIGGESGVVRIQWPAPSANGSPISSYIVRVAGDGAGAGDRAVPNASTQDIGGLANGVEYTFQVAAVNRATTEAGAEPQFSPASTPCVPDQVPSQPLAPVATWGDTEMTVTWQEPVNPGSDIQGYTLTNATTGQSTPFGPSKRRHVWPGLENGTCYRFSVVATNALGDSDPSPLSAGEQETCVPAGVPENPSVPTIDAQPAGQRDGFLRVAWTWNDSDQGNGAPVSAFRITQYRNGGRDSAQVINDGTVRTATFSTVNGEEYAYTLEAQNKAGWSAVSPHSAVGISSTVPGPIGAVTAADGNQVATLSFTAPDDGGNAISRYEYSANGGGWTALGSDRVVRNLVNGTGYTFRVRAVNDDGPAPASPDSNSVNPYGAPGTPNVTGRYDDAQPAFVWSWPAVSGNGRTVVEYRVKLDGGSWTSNGTATTYSLPVGRCRDTCPAESHTLYVQAFTNGTDPARNQSGVDSATATRQAVDLRTVSITQGRATCAPAICGPIDMSWSGFGPGSHSYTCFEDGIQFGSGTVNGDSGSVSTSCSWSSADSHVYRVRVETVASNTFTTPDSCTVENPCR